MEYLVRLRHETFYGTGHNVGTKMGRKGVMEWLGKQPGISDVEDVSPDLSRSDCFFVRYTYEETVHMARVDNWQYLFLDEHEWLCGISAELARALVDVAEIPTKEK